MNSDQVLGEVVYRGDTLLKQTADEGVQEWDVRVEARENGTADIVIHHGRQGGVKQVIRDNIAVGKNPGKKNATTPLQQAVKEAEARYKAQTQRHHYATNVADSAASRALAPMLAESFGDYVNIVDWQQAFVQPKLDGHRCLARNEGGEIRLYSRKGTLIETMGHIQEVLRNVLQPGETLDGELFVHGDITFQQIASAIRNSKKAGAVDPTRIQYHVYDAMLPGPFGSRYSSACERLRRLPRDIIVPVKTLKVATPDEVMSLQAEFVADGYEGAMLRHGLQAYQAGKRSRDLLKVKTFQDAEFGIASVTEGRGTHAGMAIFTCVVPTTNATFDVLAPGTHAQKRELYDQRDQLLGRKLTVKFQEWTTTTPPVPRFPVAIRVHEAV